ncbi:MAG: sigma-70 family RNA polymerase sigma factor [Bacteroidia bacterium]|nr:sigma-70 family RNA polymerase sigma factor [Bacteroidia bacterium]
MNINKLSDQELWKLVQTGNSEAFEAFYYRHVSFVYHQILIRVNAEEEAKDLTQEVFVALWEKKPQINQNIFSYLYSVIRYRVINHLKGKALGVKHQDIFREIIKNTQDNTPEQDQLEVNDLQSLVDQAIEKLPPKMQQVYRLSQEQGLSVQEIATQLAISSQTVKNQLSEARSRLRKILEALMSLSLVSLYHAHVMNKLYFYIYHLLIL